MIRIECKGCGSKLNAKAKLAGQTRKCPKCGTAILIPEVAEGKGPAENNAENNSVAPEASVPEAAAETSASTTPIIFTNPAAEALPRKKLLKRLNRTSRYLICDKHNVRATWNNDGRGWMLKVSSGFSSAKANRDDLPAYGSFTLIELVMKHTDDGVRLEALELYQLSSRFAMLKLERGDDDICEAIVDRGSFSRDQKASVYQIFRTLFMQDVWADSTEVVDFLLNADYHSHTSRGTEKRPEESL